VGRQAAHPATDPGFYERCEETPMKRTLYIEVSTLEESLDQFGDYLQQTIAILYSLYIF